MSPIPIRVSLCWFLLLFTSMQIVAQDLIKAAPDMPTYTLGAIQQGKDQFGKEGITISYQCSTPHAGLVKIAGRTVDGPLEIMGGQTLLNEQTGTLQLSSIFGQGKLDAEIYLVSTGSFAGQVQYTCLISNVVRVGNLPGEATTARDWNAQEKAAYQRDLLGRKPPQTLPPGYQLANANSQLAPGMPAKIGFYGEWKDAEVLTNSRRVTVRLAESQSLLLLSRDGWIAISPDDLKKAQANLGSFKPSISVIPETTSVIPDGYAIVSSDMNLYPGVPVRATWLNQLVDATVKSIDGNQLIIHFDGQNRAFDKSMPRAEILIAMDVLPKLALPDAKETFAKRMPILSDEEKEMDRFEAESRKQMNEAIEQGRKESERIRKEIEARMAETAKGQPKNPLLQENAMVNNRVPKEAEFVPLSIKLPQGTQLAACWGPQWTPLTVIEDCEDERVPVRWNTQNRESSIHRSQLIIRKADLKSLKQTVAKATSRTWKDTTGKFSIEATFVSKNATSITLKKTDGKEVTLPIAKLSKEDQAWIKESL